MYVCTCMYTHLGIPLCDFIHNVDCGIYDPDRMCILVLIDIAKSCSNLNSHQQFMRVCVNTSISFAYYQTMASLSTSFILHFLNY